ncbi:hypothetical protein B0H21DRAFT_698363 [Amylocystis lapponica]|nr:hypothetical protein B0H21DRAFT_698363 [Amylocystis lapponica]
MSREPTRHQLSARLAYNAKTPAFLQRLQNRVAGTDTHSDDEFEDDGSGRPPIPRRPAIPERPADDAGSADEDDGDERPQIVVLREGKHLTEREAENEKRKAKGLPPLPEATETQSEEPAATNPKTGPAAPKSKVANLSFSSSRTGTNSKAGKRKAVGDARDDEGEPAKKVSKKKPKKAEKKLLSFGDGDEA